MKLRAFSCSLGVLSFLWASSAVADTLRVGPGLTYTTIQAAVTDAKAGDVVEVQGDATYNGMIWLKDSWGGAKGNPVTIRGIPVNGKRPILTGVGSGQYENIV